MIKTCIYKEKKNNYESLDSGYFITSIVLGLAYLGGFMATLTFGIFISFASWSIIRKTRNKPEEYTLYFLRS